MITAPVPNADLPLLAALPPEARERNGVPTADEVAARRRGAAVVREVLGPWLSPEGLRCSPLDVAWSGDLDCHVQSMPDEARLVDAGWLALDGLLRRLGRKDCGRWGVLEDGRVLTGVDLHLTPVPDPVDNVLYRCRRRGEVRLREVLELRTLLRNGASFPASDSVLCVAAAVEAGLGGTELARWSEGPVALCPAELRGFAGFRRLLRPVRRAVRPRLVIALSGVDGAGKSTVAGTLIESLNLMGISASRVWTRPGMGRIPFAGLRRRVKRAFGEGGTGVGLRSTDPEARLRTRGGVLGWVWSLVVTLSYLIGVWRQHLQGDGIVVYDRHRPDALVTLDLIYGGASLGLQRALVSRLLPEADLAILLDIPAEIAFGRKPGDMFSKEALRRQVTDYRRRASEDPDLEVLDGQASVSALVAHILGRLL